MNNGGGLAEQNFIYAFQNLADSVDRCLDTDNACRLTDKESRILREIARERKESPGHNGLFFESGKLKPGLFETDEHGKVRVAVTGSTALSPIYINLDLIYAENVSLIDMGAALSILIHELGHHTGETDHLFLDQLGNKVRNFRERFLERIDFGRFDHPELRVSAHNVGPNIEELYRVGPVAPAKLLIENGYELKDLTEQLLAHAVCPRAGESRRAVHFTNMTWQRLRPFDTEKVRQPLTFSLDLDFQCTGAEGVKLESVRIEWTGQFQVMARWPNGEHKPAKYPEQWRSYPDHRFFVDSSVTRVIP